MSAPFSMLEINDKDDWSLMYQSHTLSNFIARIMGLVSGALFPFLSDAVAPGCCILFAVLPTISFCSRIPAWQVDPHVVYCC